MKTIAFFGLEKWEEEYLSNKLKKQYKIITRKKLTPKSAKEASKAEIIGVFVYSEVTEKILKELPKLKLITTLSTGYNHIDLEACKKRKIKVCNVPYYGENTVAEYTFALILALSRNIHKAINKTKHDDFNIEGLLGFDLKNKTLGIIGPGHIGQHVMKMAKGFEMQIQAYEEKKTTN